MTNRKKRAVKAVAQVEEKNENGIKQGRMTRKIKIAFKLALNEEQKRVKSMILGDTISILVGKAGSGKTLLASQIALEHLYCGDVTKIVITRPTISDEDLGFLPGSMKEKMDPWLAPIYANMFALYNKEKIIKDINEDKIEIAPISFLRGRTFTNSIVIVDEAQNMTKKQMQMLLTRIGSGSKMMICGDRAQIDLKKREDSGIDMLFDIGKKIDGIGFYELITNNRHVIVDKILNYIEENETNSVSKNG